MSIPQSEAALHTPDTPVAADTPVQTPPVPNPLERRLDLRIPRDEVEAAVVARLKTMAKTARMAGFRPGKLPMHLVRQQYGDSALSEVLGAAVQRAFTEQITAQSLKLAGYPQIEARPDADDGSYQFCAIFEVLPTVVLGDLTGVAIEKPTLELSDAHIDQTLEQLRAQRTTYESITEPAALGDRMIINFTGRKNGETFEGGSAQGFAVQLGSGMMIADFEQALIGLAPQAQKTFDATFPADYHAADLAGQTINFTVDVQSVMRAQIPPLDADFARALGVDNGDLNQLRQEVGDNLAREVKKRLQARLTKAVMDALLAATPVDAPQTLVHAEAREMAENTRRHLEQQGIQSSPMPLNFAMFKDAATRRVKLGLILSTLTAQHGLEAKPEQVRALIEEHAATFEDPQEVVRWYYEKPERLAEAHALTTENNVVTWVLTQATVTEKPLSLEELMHEHQAS
jgi:trigger factor